MQRLGYVYKNSPAKAGLFHIKLTGSFIFRIALPQSSNL